MYTQLAQFAAIFLQSCLALLSGPDCGSPDFVKVLLIIYMGSLLLLFGVFFTQRYILKVHLL
jgi:GNS1/SUR4 family